MTHIEILSLILSVTGLIASIIFGISIFDLHKRAFEIKAKEEKIEKAYNKVIKLTIASYATTHLTKFVDNNQMIDGKDIVSWALNKYNCEDELVAIDFLELGGDRLIEEYIKEKGIN